MQCILINLGLASLCLCVGFVGRITSVLCNCQRLLVSVVLYNLSPLTCFFGGIFHLRNGYPQDYLLHYEKITDVLATQLHYTEHQVSAGWLDIASVLFC